MKKDKLLRIKRRVEKELEKARLKDDHKARLSLGDRLRVVKSQLAEKRRGESKLYED